MKIIKIIKRLLCVMGMHDWNVSSSKGKSFVMRTCNKCSSVQRGSYDMMYGTTNWE